MFKKQKKFVRFLGFCLGTVVLISSFFLVNNSSLLLKNLPNSSKVSAQTLNQPQSLIIIAQDPSPAQKSESSNSSQQEKPKLEVFPMILGMLGGLSLFLYGMEQLSVGLRELAGDKMKNLLSRFTTNRYAGVATGTVVTGILDSSSVTIIMVIALVDAGLLSFAQSLGVVMGANIGTTLGAQVYAFDVEQYGPIFFFIGLILNFFGKSDRLKEIGLILLGIGLLFFGLYQMGEALEPLKDYSPFLKLMERVGENTLLGAVIGAGVTVLVQSSSATIAIVITMASQGLISLPAGIAIMLGAELGTVSDTLIATIRRSRSALRTGVFHLIFNLTTCIVGLLLAAQLASLGQWLAFGGGVPRQIANAQIVFNVVGVIAFIGFVPWFAKVLNKLIPEKPALERQEQYIR